MKVVRLGAWCEFSAQHEQALSFDVSEFAVLADGRRLTLHAERGFTTSVHAVGVGPLSDPWSHLWLEALDPDVRTTVLPDDDDTQDEHPWEWLAGLLRAHGIEASPAELKDLPYDVEFGPRVRARLGHTGYITQS